MPLAAVEPYRLRRSRSNATQHNFTTKDTEGLSRDTAHDIAESTIREVVFVLMNTDSSFLGAHRKFSCRNSDHAMS
jgi:hypothetical protein